MYTLQQYQRMERFENGAVWRWHADPAADDVIRFLMDAGLLSSREDLGPGVLSLTEKGRSVLEAKRNHDAEKKEQEAKEENAEAKRLQERNEDHTREERYNRTRNKIAIWAIVVPVLTFFLGMLVESLTGAAGNVIQIFIHF